MVTTTEEATLTLFAPRFIIAVALATAIALTGARGAVAIEGPLDQGGHPNVGLLGYERDGVATGFCSGALVAPTVFLTAGHCTAALAGAGFPAWVSFASTFDAATSERIAVSAFHTAFTPDYSIKGYDIGVAVLARAPGLSAAPLAPVGTLDLLYRSAEVVSVGYGRCGRDVGGGQPTWCAGGSRRAASAEVASLNANWARLDGATCFGDSGGPHFVGGAIVAITTGGSGSCAGNGVNYRIDTPAARAFLEPFLG